MIHELLDVQSACAEAGVDIRWQIRKDVGQCLAIDAATLDPSWCETDFLDCLRENNCIAMVAIRCERVVGFMVYALHRTSLNVLRFAVDPACQRQGIGTAMVARLIDKLNRQRRTRIEIDVPDHLLPMHCFLREMGFVATPSAEDCYRFEWSLD